jgi:predicted transcriptional regulator
MSKTSKTHLTRREREIMDIVYRLGEASVKDIQERLRPSPTDGAVRRMLHLLQEKGRLESRQEGATKVYRPTTGRKIAGEAALRHVVETFFAGSAARTMASLFQSSDLELSDEDRLVLRELIAKARGQGR